MIFACHKYKQILAASPTHFYTNQRYQQAKPGRQAWGMTQNVWPTKTAQRA